MQETEFIYKKTPQLEQTIEKKSRFTIKDVRNECTVKNSWSVCKWSSEGWMIVAIFKLYLVSLDKSSNCE